MSYKETEFDPFAGPEIDYILNTTKAQSEIWSACYFGGEDAVKAYNESITLDFNGPMDATAMDKAVSLLMERHEALRATFSTDGIYMTVYKQAIAELSNIDLTNLEENNKEQAVQAYIKEEVNFLFELVQGPLIKFSLLTLSKTNHKLIITAHHIICDGWSIGIMLQDLGELYSAYTENRTPNLIEPIAFSAYAKGEAAFSTTDEYKATAKFWYDIYKNEVPVVTVPTDYSRPSIRTYKSNRIDFTLDTQTLANLKQTGLSVGASLVATLLTCFELFLYQLTGQEDLVVGLPYAGQPVTGMNHLVGHCVSLLPLRSKPNPNLPFTEYLRQRKSELFDAYEKPQLSFGHLLEKLPIARDSARIPLVPIVFNIDMGMTDGVEFSNLKYKLISNPRAYEAFEIFINASGTEKNLVFEWSYNEALFEQETIKKMMFSFEKIIQKIIEQPSKTVEEITYQDWTDAYEELNATTSKYSNIAIPDLFARQVSKTPDKIAIEFVDKTFSYKHLEEQTNQLAHYLQELGVASGDIIAVSLPKSPDLIISLLAIMQCGAAYLPLDPEYPAARLQFMMEDSSAKFLLTSAILTASLPKCLHTIVIEDGLSSLNKYPITKTQNTVAPNETAYLIYTSGSTGSPKGVSITHKNLVNFLSSMALEPGINETDRLLSITTISFDIAYLELFLPLTNGATLVLTDRETASDARLLLDILQTKNISILQATPTTWQMIIDLGWSKPLTIKALCGGEALPLDLAKKLIERCDTLWNVYGPTETTIWSSIKQIKAEDTVITIGKPIANTQMYIANKTGKILAPGHIGEIVIGGDGLSKGYWKRPELTDEKYIIKEFSKSKTSIIYRTGDLGKLLPTNEIICFGRIDQQVKIRGHRIEPAEIEQELLVFEYVKNVVVLANKNQLIAYIVPVGGIEKAREQIPVWREALSLQLPSHLVPQSFILVKEFPITLNGKIDRKSLLEYKSADLKNHKFTAPRTENEKLVATIWKECLKLEEIDIFSNFFEVGGHSIMAVKILMELQKQTGKQFPLSALFQYSTVETFAKLLSSKQEFSSDYLVPLKPIGNKTPLFIIHGAGLNILNFSHVINHFDQEQPVYGFQGIGPNGYKDWFESIEDMAATYIQSIIKVNPNGPYAIAGFSFGGIVAFEIARQLKEQGKKVSIIALLDSYVDTSYYYPSALQKKLIRHRDRTQRRLDYSFQMLTSWKAFKIRFNSKKQYLQQKYFGLETVMPEQEADALVKFTEANAMVNKIVDRYHLRPQELEVELFRAEEDESYKLDPTHLGWKKAALNGVNIHNISGNHLDIVAPPNDKILARMLQDLLDERHRQS
jgi:amino acid adenylation domain-containing protein